MQFTWTKIKSATRRSERATFRLRRLRGELATVRLWQMPFPTTQLLSVEQFSMVAAVLRFTPSECGFIDLFPNPSLSCLDFCSAVGTYVGVAGDHFSPPSRRCDAIVGSE